MSQLILQPNARILFQGDSITDAGRDRANAFGLGSGYPNMVAAWLSARYPELHLTFQNRGVSGDRVCDLEARWSEDCVQLQPDWLSILVGINDTWRIFDSNLPSPIPEFDAGYRRLLDRVKAETTAQVILLEPFVLPSLPDRRTWREDVSQRIDVVRAIAQEYQALYIPLDGIFAAASTRREPAFWSEDGVHPSQVGHALIAQEWIRAIGG